MAEEEVKPDLDKVLDKMRKLLALSKSPNEHEAARAAERVQALLVRYNLSLVDVEKGPASEIDADYNLRTTPYKWRRTLGTSLAKMYFTRYFYSTLKDGKTVYDAHGFIGERQNIMVAKMMFEYLIKTIDRLAMNGAKVLPEAQRSPYRTDFRKGCSYKLCERIRKRVEDAKAGLAKDEDTKTNLPALLSAYTKADAAIDGWIKKNMSGEIVKHVYRPDKLLHERGFLDGQAAGDRISLDQQIDDDARPRINHKFP